MGSEARSRRGDDDHLPASTVAGQDGAGDPPKNRALTPVSHDRAAGVSLADFRSARSRDHEAGGGDHQAIQSHRLQHADALLRDSRSGEPENRRRQSPTDRDWLAAAGYEHYEISNWGLPGFESRHNLKYWRREPYFGFGAGAHSFNGSQRWANAHDAAAYVTATESGRLPVEQLEAVTPESALEEELFLGLRQLDGIDVGRIEREYGVAVTPRFDRLMSAGMVERNGNVVRLAGSKLAVANEVFVELMK